MTQELGPQRPRSNTYITHSKVGLFKVGRTDGKNAVDILEGQLKVVCRVLGGKGKFRAV